jgi:hypothetical protein
VIPHRERVDAWTERMRAGLVGEEQILAMGRCEDISSFGGIERGGIGRTYLIVTSRRLFILPHLDPRFEASLDLADVDAVIERTLGHRYAITMRHHPVVRLHVEPARFAPQPIPGALSRAPLDRTTLAFSRRDTRVAIALRDQLEARGVLSSATP